MRIGLAVSSSVLLACATTSTTTAPAKQLESNAVEVGAPVPKALTAPAAATLLAGSADAFAAECSRALTAARAHLARMKKLSDQREVLVAFDAANAELSNTGARCNLAKNVHPHAEFRRAAEACEQQLSKLNTELAQDGEVYASLLKVDLTKEDEGTRTWMERTLLDFRRAGVDRDEATRAKVKALNEQLVKLGQAFQKNIRDDERSVSFKPGELLGLPEDYIRAHPPGKEGKVTVTTNYPDYFPFMMYAKSAKAREVLWRAYRLRGHPANLEVLSQMLAKRHEFATLLGYDNWAAYNTETKMARTDKAAAQFIEKLNDAALARAKQDYQLLLERKRKDDKKAQRLEPWEHEFYEDKVKSEQFGFDSQSLRPYFEYGRVQQGVMDTAARMFGVTFRRIEDARVWHPDVQTFDVYEGEKLLGRIHLDMHPREGKYKHAAHFDTTMGQKGVRLPEGTLVCNFPKSTPESPGLMQQSEVETLFHEFGHLLHHIFGGQQRWAEISGNATERDFVEVPSMLLQEWGADPQVLQQFAVHHQTGEAVPAELLAKLRASKELGKGMYTRRQLYLSSVSLEFHRLPPGFDHVEVFSKLQSRFTPFRIEHVDGTYFHLAFTHLKGYQASYYTYLWAQVIAKDMLSAFEKKGMLDADTAGRFRTAVLNPGGSVRAEKMVREFLGREHDFAAYERWLNQ